ncbi:nucleotidyltransferase domain-containing protein [Methylobacter sp. YRD-M1]|uniref:nucleotidyltransferase domain-containing protein n=1 Tax=Methylobacter sp. YRD-M1 TaxID=2911520 RepID=UPI00227BAE71|nr:nucleotidyltransferase domain-containing protein [Methylobacter sp. YRD-M1]WAK03732.1 nucleotidyltransferase domain-containing protein [Methylobacter sp. YRD-M1]
MKYGLKNQTIAQINAVFARHSEIEQVILYGSRAKGNFKDSSDIDLALKGHNLNSSIIDRINFELDGLFLPYCFDISLFSRINNARLIDHINHIGVIFYESANAPHLDRQNSDYD